MFEVLPRRINIHLPDTRLLVEGQSEATTAAAEAAVTGTVGAAGGSSGGGSSSGGSKKRFGWIRQRAMRTGENTA